MSAASETTSTFPQASTSVDLPSIARMTPPAGRDFDVYEAIVVQGGTTRSAAHRFGISQTRVMQVLEKVRQWLREIELPVADEQTSARDLALAQRLAVDRLQFLYGQALVGWNSSQGNVSKTRTAANGDAVMTETESYGDPKYLAAAARLATQCAKLGTCRGMLIEAQAAAAPEETSDDVESSSEVEPSSAVEPSDLLPSPLAGEGPGVRRARGIESEAAHPDGACSENRAARESGPRERIYGTAVTREAASGYAALNPRQRAKRREFFAPVQAPEPDETSPAARRVPNRPR